MTGEQGWSKSQMGLQACVELLDEHTGGPFVEGAQFSYTDCILCSTWMTYRRTGESIFEKIIAYDGCLQKHFDACRPYLQRIYE